MSNKIMLFLLIQNILMIYTVSSIEICSNEIQAGREVILDKVYHSGGSCGCSVKLVGGEENSLVTFQSTRNPAGCQYKLIFSMNTITREYSCNNYLTLYQFNMTSADNLYVYLLNDKNNTSGFVFNLTVQRETKTHTVVLTCSSPWVIPLVTNQIPTTQTPTTQTSPSQISTTQTSTSQTATTQTSPSQISTTQTSTSQTPTTQTSTTQTATTQTPTTQTPTTQTSTTQTATSQTPTTQTATSQTATTQTTTQTSPTTGNNNIHFTSTTATSGESESTETTDKSITTEEYQNLDLPVIVGCAVGGVVLVCVVVVIVLCFLKRRKQKGQTDQNLSDQNLTDGNLYSNSIYDNSSPTQHQNTVDRNSYSDCYDHIPNDSLQIRNKNQVVMMSNNNTDSLDNDDYSKYGETASEHYESVPDQLEHVPEQPEHVPNTEVEYAVVQKKPKKNASPDKAFELNNSRKKRIVHDDYENVGKDNLNLKREINRIVGPKGDDYTLVNKS